MAGTLHTKEYSQLCEKLKQKRVSMSFTQVELAEKLGKPQSYVAKYETAERRLDILEVRDICKILNISVSEII